LAIVHLHETYVTDTESNLDARFASLSGQSIAEPYRLQRGAVTLAYDLGLEDVHSIALSQLPTALALTFYYHDLRALQGELKLDWEQMIDPPDPDTALYRFSEYLSYAEIVPFQASPLDLHSLAGIATLSPVGIGATIAFAVFGLGASPLLLIAVPAGMIVCGAAAGIAQGLNEGLRHKMLSFLQPRTQEEVEADELLLNTRRVHDAKVEEQAKGEAQTRTDETQATQRSDVIGARGGGVIGAEPAQTAQPKQEEQEHQRSSDS
jgi:hypothetical protein